MPSSARGIVRRRLPALALALAALATAPAPGRAAVPVDAHGLPAWVAADWRDAPVRLELADRAALDRLLAAVPLAGFDREGVARDPATGRITLTVRVTDAEAAALAAAGYAFERLPDRLREGREAAEAFWADAAAKDFAGLDPDKALYYPTHAQIGADLAALAAAHPTLARTFTLGTSVQGRELWGIVISDDVQNTEAEPEVMLSSTIHGDEPVGMVLLWELARYLLENYGQPGYENVTGLVDGTEIHIVPLYNPDGYVAGTRTNALGVDLNRNFPDPAGTHLVTQPENLAYMGYGLAHHFVVGENGHGGSLVVNYPWDYTYVRAPDDAALIDLSLEYSSYNPPMYASGIFPDGITNGADWYVVTGSLQDWAYWNSGCMHVTIELGNQKWPSATTLDGYWDDNRESLLHFIAAARYGIHGVVTGADTGQPLAATVATAGIAMDVSTDPAHGDYWKVLPTGSFDLTFTAPGYRDSTIAGVGATWGAGTTLDVALEPVFDPSPVPGNDVFVRIDAAPNPFNPATTISVGVGQAGAVGLRVYDVKGFLVRTLVDDDLPAGTYQFTWDGRDGAGAPVSAGVYIAQLVQGDRRAARKLLMVK